MSRAPRRIRPPAAFTAATLVVASSLAVMLSAQPAGAVTADQPLSSAPSSMWQTNETVRTLAVSNGVLYAGGDFTAVRPPGSPSGTNQTTRTRLAAFNANTGALVTTFDANINGSVFSLSVSPDGSRLYAAGSFTTVNGAARNRLAAFSLPGGALVTGWAPNASATVTAVKATASAIYVGGDFANIGGVARSKVAALNTSNGAVIAAFTASADDRVVAIETATDGSRVLIGGTFRNVNGVAQNAIASLDPTTGSTMPWAATGIAPDQPNCLGHVTDIEVYADTAYISGEDENAGCWDGTYAAKVADGAVVWSSLCYGGSLAVKVVNGWLYKGSHQHDCGYDPGGYVGSQNRDLFFWNRLVAQSLTTGAQGHWTPNTNGFTSPTPVGPRVLATDGTQLFVGGDFSTVNNAGQQGLTRFQPGNGSTPDVPAAPQVTATAAGTLTVQVGAVSDRENGVLTYRLYRDGGATPIATQSIESWPFTRPTLRFDDTGLAAGSTHTYAVTASDGTRTSARSANSTAVSVAAVNPPSYPTTVLATAPNTYWRLADAGGTAADSSAAGLPGAYIGGVTQGASGAIVGDNAVTLDGSTGYVTSDAQATPTATFTQSVWFRTTSIAGGALLGLSNERTGPGTLNDRVVWMDNNGQLAFGLRQTQLTNRFSYVRSPNSYNDGLWHQVAASYNGTTMSLYVDGTLAASLAASHMTPVPGHQRVGYTDLTRFDTVFGAYNGQGRYAPNSFYFNGQVDELATWPSALSEAQVRSQWISSVVGGVAPPPPPPPTGYSEVVLADSPSLYWRLDQTSATAVVDSSGNGRTGTYRAGLVYNAAGAIGDGNTAVSCPGTSGVAYTNASQPAPSTYSVEVWFRSTSTSGGKLIGMENVQTGWGTSYDRQVYLTNSGAISYGIVAGGARAVVSSAAGFNNGAWHHVVATQGPAGMILYVDGVVIGSNPTVTPDSYVGFWRVGGGNLTGWPSASSSSAVAGTLDEVAVYPAALTSAQVAAHYAAGTA